MTARAAGRVSLGFALALAVLLPCVSPGGEIHRWVDENGQVHFGDKPPASGTNETIEKVTVKPNVYSTPSVEKLAKDFVAPPAEVVLYSASWCGYCRQAREYFVNNGIAFREYDVERSSKGRRDFRRLRAAGVPVILVGGQRLNGFHQAAFDRLYAPN
ncbi:MAG: glutaredoxin family protein [Pseudomonadota bacterium]